MKLDDLMKQATDLKTQLDSVNSQIATVNATDDFLSKSHPAGLDPSWQAIYDGVYPDITITAWFNPNKFGNAGVAQQIIAAAAMPTP